MLKIYLERSIKEKLSIFLKQLKTMIITKYKVHMEMNMINSHITAINRPKETISMKQKTIEIRDKI